jgi:hypothetical protein
VCEVEATSVFSGIVDAAGSLLGLTGVILSGVLVFVVGQIALKSIIEPAQEFRAAIGYLQYVILKNWPAITSPRCLRVEDRNTLTPRTKYANDELKEAAARLYPTASRIAPYCLGRWIFQLPEMKNIGCAIVQLRGMANSLDSEHEQHGERMSKRRRRIFILLRAQDPVMGDREEDE